MKETAMLNKILTLATVAALAAVLMPSKVDAYGAAHVGYTHVGPSGVYHTGKTAAYGPGGAYAGGHTGAYDTAEALTTLAPAEPTMRATGEPIMPATAGLTEAITIVRATTVGPPT